MVKRDFNWIRMIMIFLLHLGVVVEVLAQEPSRETFPREKEKTLRVERGEARGGRDPFLLPQGVLPLSKIEPAPSTKEGPPPLPPWEVKAILISDRIRLASIGHHIVTLGDRIGEERVLEIQPDQVILIKDGKKRTLSLKQSPVRLTIEEKKGKGESR